MKKNGFTLVELITTFALTAVIIVLLINVVIIIKNVYSNTNIKTELYINQSNLSNVLNKKISTDNFKSYEDCVETEYLLCKKINFVDDSSATLMVSEKSIQFGDYVYNLSEGTSVNNPEFIEEYLSQTNLTKNNTFIVIKIPIKNELYPNIDFGINLVYPYNSNQ